MINAFSILHYAVIGANVPDAEPLDISIAGSFFVAWVLLVVFTPLELTEYVRSRRGFVIAFVCVMIVVEAIILPLLARWPWWILFAVLILFASVWIPIARDRQETHTHNSNENEEKA
jgi:fatty acid desaturase